MNIHKKFFLALTVCLALAASISGQEGFKVYNMTDTVLVKLDEITRDYLAWAAKDQKVNIVLWVQRQQVAQASEKDVQKLLGQKVGKEPGLIMYVGVPPAGDTSSNRCYFLQNDVARQRHCIPDSLLSQCQKGFVACAKEGLYDEAFWHVFKVLDVSPPPQWYVSQSEFVPDTVAEMAPPEQNQDVSLPWYVWALVIFILLLGSGGILWHFWEKR